jgi:hypothetical protein
LFLNPPPAPHKLATIVPIGKNNEEGSVRQNRMVKIPRKSRGRIETVDETTSGRLRRRFTLTFRFFRYGQHRLYGCSGSSGIYAEFAAELADALAHASDADSGFKR